MCLVGTDAEDSELQESAEIHEIPVVREKWVLYSVRCKQRLPLSCFQAPFGDDQAGQVFGHLNVCLGGITMKDKQSLWALIVSKGGNITYELNKDTTHLVVGAASGPKYFEALKRNGVGHNNASIEDKKEDVIKIVTPDWITQCIKQKSRLLEKEFHPRLMTLPGQPVAQPKARRPKNRVKPRPLQLPVGPTKHTTRIATPASTRISGTPSSGPPNPLLLKQLQGGKTPTGIATPGRFTSPVVLSSKGSLPPPPTLPMARVSLAPSPATPVQARKSAPVPVSSSSATSISVTSAEKSDLKTSSTTSVTTSITKPSAIVTSISNMSSVSEAKNSNPVTAEVLHELVPKSDSNTTISKFAGHSAITAIKSPATAVSTTSDPNTVKVVTTTGISSNSSLVTVTAKNSLQTSSNPAVLANTSVTIMSPIVSTSTISQNITAAQNVTVTSGSKPLLTSSGSSIRLPQTPVSMSTAQMLAGQKPLPPASIAAQAQSIGTKTNSLAQTPGFSQVASTSVSVATTNTKPAVLQQQQPLPINSVPISQQNAINLPKQPTTTVQLPNMQATMTNVLGPNVGSQNQILPQNVQQMQQPQQMQQVSASATVQPGQPTHPKTIGNMQPVQPGQQTMQAGQSMTSVQNQQWNQQQWQGNQSNSFPQPQQWQQGQPMAAGQMNQQLRPRQVTPHMVQQQQIIQRHIASLTLEQRNQFTQMPAREKQMYLHQRGLLLTPQSRPMLALTEEQKQMLQTMDPQQKAAFIEKLRKDAQMRQQVMIQRQQMAQQQQAQQTVVSQGQQMQQTIGGANANQAQQMQQWSSVGQGTQPQQYGQNIRGPSHTSPQPMQTQQQISPSGSITPPNARMQMPGNMQLHGQNRPQWSGETHPALAQVPRTPQQLQHLQRLQLQREQQLEQQQMLPQQRPQTPVSMSPLGSGGASGQQSPVGPQMSGPPQSPQVPQSPQGMGQMQQQFMQPTPLVGQPVTTMNQGTVGVTQNSQIGTAANPNQKTKAALASMINNRLQQPQTPNLSPGGMPIPGAIQQQPMPAVPPPQQMPPQMSPQNVGGGSPAMDVSATSRLQMMNQQLQHQIPGQPPPPGAAIIASQQSMVGQPPSMFAQQQRQQLSPQHHQYLAMSQQRRALETMGQRGPIPPQISGSPVSPHAMGPRFIGPRGPIGMQHPHMRPGMAQIPPMAQRQPIFYGHDPNSVGKLPPEYCLLGCIFYIIDYQEDSDESKYVRDWKKVIRQFGGEVEDAYHQRITHLMCKHQDTSVSAQALREGKRLVTVYWLNDVVVLRKVVPPWKGVHFPLPANFDEPCKHMILTLTGFEGRDRDWVKDMIKLSGAKYTSYFTRHNHAIICKSTEGEKYIKAKEWKVPTVSVQWLNEVLFGNVNGAQVMNNPKFQNFKLEDPFKMEYALVPNLIAAWKHPIGVTRETYQKFKANPPRSKRKTESLRIEEEGAKRLRLQEEPNKANVDLSTSKMVENDTEIKLENGENEGALSKENGAQNGVGQNNGDIKGNDTIDENENQNKIKTEVKDGGNGSKSPCILFTGFVPSSLSEMERMARDLGATVVTLQNASKATHMVMPKLGRTMAFLCGLTYVKYILSSTWIEHSNKENKFLGMLQTDKPKLCYISIQEFYTET